MGEVIFGKNVNSLKGVNNNLSPSLYSEKVLLRELFY
jgi:hypothetical protein